MSQPYDIVAFDADDTLWASEDSFRANELRFVELIQPYADPGIDVKAALTAVERRNLSALGYGVKAFAISMVEAAITISGGAVPTGVIAELVEMARTQLEEPVRLLPQQWRHLRPGWDDRLRRVQPGGRLGGDPRSSWCSGC
jgi:putative hydrolase of the HAD superfamily